MPDEQTHETPPFDISGVAPHANVIAYDVCYNRNSDGAGLCPLSSSTALFWGWAHFSGRLPEPVRAGVDPKEEQVHDEPRA